METVRAFNKWDTELIHGNPFKQQGVLRVFLAEPQVPLIYDTENNRIGFITQRVAVSNKYILPKANRTAEEKQKAVYHAIFSPLAEWVIQDGGYMPNEGSDVWELVKELVPAVKKQMTRDEIMAEIRENELRDIRSAVALSETELPYRSFPMTQRQMIQQAAYNENCDPLEYIKTRVSPVHRSMMFLAFGIDTSKTTV